MQDHFDAVSFEDDEIGSADEAQPLSGGGAATNSHAQPCTVQLTAVASSVGDNARQLGPLAGPDGAATDALQQQRTMNSRMLPDEPPRQNSSSHHSAAQVRLLLGRGVTASVAAC